MTGNRQYISPNPGKRLRSIRMAKGIKASWVAHRMGITRSMLSMLEHGARGWDERRVADFEKAVGE